MVGKKIPAIVKAFEDFALFCKNKWKATILAIVFIAIMGILTLSLYFGYVQIKKLENASAEANNSINERLTEISPSPLQQQEMLVNYNRINKIIDSQLDEVLQSGGQRSYLIRFHNGEKDINGTHFIFMSTTNEKTAPGISNVMVDFQKIHTSYMRSEWIDKFLNNECVAINIDDLSESDSMKIIMKRIAIKRCLVCPVYDVEKNFLMGLVGMSWVTYFPDEQECSKTEEALRGVNKVLSGVLSTDKDKDNY